MAWLQVIQGSLCREARRLHSAGPARLHGALLRAQQAGVQGHGRACEKVGQKVQDESEEGVQVHQGQVDAKHEPGWQV